MLLLSRVRSSRNIEPWYKPRARVTAYAGEAKVHTLLCKVLCSADSTADEIQRCLPLGRSRRQPTGSDPPNGHMELPIELTIARPT